MIDFKVVDFDDIEILQDLIVGVMCDVFQQVMKMVQEWLGVLVGVMCLLVLLVVLLGVLGMLGMLGMLGVLGVLFVLGI